MRTKRSLAALAAGLLVVGLTACSSAEGESKEATHEVNEEIRAMLPEDIRKKGVISVVTDPSHPPFEFIDEDEEVTGLNPELAEAVADILGVELTWETTDFAGLITGITSRRYDVSIVAMFDTVERQQQVDFIDNYIDALKIIVPEGNPNKITDLPDFCGRTISTLQGSVMLDMLEEHQADCGANPMEITVAATTSEQLLWLDTGRADASIANGTVTQFSIDQRGARGIEVVHDNAFMRNYYGWGIHKDNTQLRDALAAALDQLIEDGTYEKILTKWGATDANAVPSSVINGGGSL